ncbi:N-acetyl-gamma-glutamyl-phosphate reductase [candidate division KSB1 bacterium]|nr:N-acetyl-gamma-glutamyl-phosphate reductase [candidate division KSB1 bacterium]
MKKIGIIGATGYTGEELLKVLVQHDSVEVDFVTSEKDKDRPLATIYPHLPAYKNKFFISAQQASELSVDLVFLCLPAGESANLAEIFLSKNVKVIDLGADFRFKDPEIYKKWYNMDHATPELLDKAVYGLPEWYREDIKKSNIVGNPGCYPTGVLLAVLPLLKKHLLSDDMIIADSKSGVSGAGKAATSTTHYVNVNENLSPYKAGRTHRHVGEMEQELTKCAGRETRISFTPHLLPVTRGLFSTIYVKTKQQKTKQHILDIMESAYRDEPFVHVVEEGYPSIKMAANTNYCFIGAETVPDSNTVILFSAIDNLGKGASTQAIQNMNLMLGFPETKGLLT